MEEVRRVAEYATNPDTSIARGAVNAIGGMGVKVPSCHGDSSTYYATTLAVLALPMANALTTATPTMASRCPRARA
eukprot:scaffold104878_cov21-Phaeocystis_antarctica.AAC.1